MSWTVSGLHVSDLEGEALHNALCIHTEAKPKLQGTEPVDQEGTNYSLTLSVQLF